MAFLEQLMLKEKPKCDEWNELNEQKCTILLNLSLCLFNKAEYYTCLQHVNTVLESQPNNVKAIYRRAKVYIATHDFEDARRDLDKCAQLDPKLANDVQTLLEHIKKLETDYKKKEMDKFKGKLFSS